MTSQLDTAWLEKVGETVPKYLAQLRVDGTPGRYLPSLQGATSVGRAMALGFSSFALRTHLMLGTLQQLPSDELPAWANFIKSFQQRGGEGAFIDKAEIQYLERHTPWRERLPKLFGRVPQTNFVRSIILAETKQAIAALADIGAEPARHFHGFPVTPLTLRTWLDSQDWRRPWGAGGQAAGIVVFIKTQAPAFLSPREVEDLISVCRDFYTGLAHRETGAYFRGAAPKHGELINGAMKVLMALDWLGVAPHYADELVATCLAEPPSSAGCHLVDAIYVLHQCTNGRISAEVRDYCLKVVDMIREHAHDDGGFSFYRDKAQTNYYGVPITRGLAESDVQGTCLLVWALAMIWRMLEPESARWKLFKP